MNLAKSRRGTFEWVPSLIALALVGLLGCSPANVATGPNSNSQVAPVPTGPKTLVMSIQTEPAHLVEYGRVPTANPGPENYYIFHANLTIFDAEGNPVAYAAQKVPKVEDGDWKLNPDGSMEVTWKIRPDVKWQDGTPLTSADFVFGYEVVMDPKLVIDGGIENLRAISSVKAVDPQTFVVNWKAPWIYANTNTHEAIPAINKAQVEPLYRSLDPVAFEASQVWRSELIGLGPFRVTEWALGDHVSAEAFDKFFLGRPKIDRLELRWMPVTIVVARMLAGALDVMGRGAFAKTNQLYEIQAQKGPNWGTAFVDRTLVRSLKLNFREDQPWAKDVRFRQAMVYAMNRPGIAEAAGGPLAETTEFTLDQVDPVRKLLDQGGVQRYPYDPTRAAQLFAEAGWTKGSDGMLRNSAGATVDFPCCRYGNVDAENTRESLIWGDDLKKAGIDAHHPIAAVAAGLSALDTRKAQNFGWGGQVTNIYLTLRQHFGTIESAQIPNDANRWTGTNNGGWSNPAFDRLLAERFATLAIEPRRQKELQLIKTIADEVPIIPAYFLYSIEMAREGITNVKRPVVLNDAITQNIYEWDMK